ncbi:MAG: type III pantothenate kinase [Oscillatoriales cyanobacterium SM2_2_1]|nr:type III pantothenate kinase [Oscillatoriales cyanobacterium SM2_2_1]
MSKWMAIAIGNSRIRVAAFDGRNILNQWQGLPTELEQRPPWTDNWQWEPQQVVIASVGPQGVTPWHSAPNFKVVTLGDVPLTGLYPGMGIDRALVALGAGVTLGFPVLAIDGGTAISITAVGGDRRLLGGMILPGLGLQVQSLHQGTAALPRVTLPAAVPHLWAQDTQGAIQSGIIHTIRAGIIHIIEKWQSQLPGATVCLTGGDGAMLSRWGVPGIVEPDALWLGIAEI